MLKHPLRMQVHPPTAKSTLSKIKEKLNETQFKLTFNKFVLVLMVILGLFLGHTAVMLVTAV